MPRGRSRWVPFQQTYSKVHSSPQIDDMLLKLATTIQVHDEPERTPWFCGRCPYMNSGSLCSKCGAPRWEGTDLR
jgi:hypothetical protein